MAKRGEIVEDQELFGKKKFDKLANISGGIAAFVGGVGWVLLRRRGYFNASNPNNSGFLLLHQGMVERADSISDATVRHGDHDALILANFALCRAAQNDFIGADQLLRAAKFSGPNSGRIGAIVEFNDALIHLLKKDEAKAFELLAAAHKKAKDIRRYCEYSVFLDPVRKNQDYIDALTARAG